MVASTSIARLSRAHASGQRSPPPENRLRVALVVGILTGLPSRSQRVPRRLASPARHPRRNRAQRRRRQRLRYELVLTGFLMFVIMAVATDTRAVRATAAIAHRSQCRSAMPRSCRKRNRADRLVTRTLGARLYEEGPLVN
jgi:hypothetical protein